MSEVEPILLLCDLDGVVVDFYAGFRKAWQLKYGGEYLPDPTSFEVSESYPSLDPNDVYAIWQQKDFFVNLDPMPGAIEAIETMQQCDIDLFICSSPSAVTSWSEKAEWVEHFLGPEWTRKLILTKDKTLVVGDYLLDDKPKIEGYCVPQWEQILFDGQYNEEYDDKFRMNWTNWPRLLRHHGAKR